MIETGRGGVVVKAKNAKRKRTRNTKERIKKRRTTRNRLKRTKAVHPSRKATRHTRATTNMPVSCYFTLFTIYVC